MKAVSPIAVIILASAAAFGRGAAGQASGIDITGAWFNVYQGTDSNAAIPLVAYGGYPLSEAGRMYALTWDPSRMTLRQQQCAQYIFFCTVVETTGSGRSAIPTRRN